MRAGVSPNDLRAAISGKQVHRTSPGVYALPDSPPHLKAIYAAKARPACVTAASVLGLWVLQPPMKQHVAVDHGRPVRDFKVHRHTGELSSLEVVVQCLRCLPELDALVIAESAVVLGKVSLETLRRRISGRKDARLRSVCEQINPHAESIIETVGRYHLHNAGLHVQTQLRIQGVGRLDLFVDGVLGIEADGAEYHSSRMAYREDRRRWNRLTRGGVPVLRLPYEVIVHESEDFVSLVMETLATIHGR